jgi:hypothetical protein
MIAQHALSYEDSAPNMNMQLMVKARPKARDDLRPRILLKPTDSIKSDLTICALAHVCIEVLKPEKSLLIWLSLAN